MSNLFRALDHIETKFAALKRELPKDIGDKLSFTTDLRRVQRADLRGETSVTITFGGNVYNGSAPTDNPLTVLAQINSCGKMLEEHLTMAQFFADELTSTGRGVAFAYDRSGSSSNLTQPTLICQLGDVSVRVRTRAELPETYYKLTAMLGLYQKLQTEK